MASPVVLYDVLVSGHDLSVAPMLRPHLAVHVCTPGPAVLSILIPEQPIGECMGVEPGTVCPWDPQPPQAYGMLGSNPGHPLWPTCGPPGALGVFNAPPGDGELCAVGACSDLGTRSAPVVRVMTSNPTASLSVPFHLTSTISRAHEARSQRAQTKGEKGGEKREGDIYSRCDEAMVNGSGPPPAKTQVTKLTMNIV